MFKANSQQQILEKLAKKKSSNFSQQIEYGTRFYNKKKHCKLFPFIYNLENVKFVNFYLLV